MSLQFSRLNFKAKNQASTLAIHDPYASKFLHKEAFENIEQERNSRIMEIFQNLPLDDNE